MGRMTYIENPMYPQPQLGQIVFYHPKRTTENTPSPLPAIIHSIRDLSRGVVDLTVFAPKGPIVKQDVEQAGGAVEERWSQTQS